MNRIGLDARMIGRSGIGTYIKGLIQGFSEVGFLKHSQLELFGGKDFPKEYRNLSHHPFHSPIYSLFEQAEYPRRLRKVHLWHAPHYNVPISKGPCKLVATVHDIIHWIFRKEFYTSLQAFYAGRMLRHTVRSADHIIAVSHRTRDDLIQHFAADPEKITVIYEGVDPRFQPISDRNRLEETKKKLGIPGPYFLYVGLLKPHKNLLWLVRIFDELKKSGALKASLVLVGKKDRNYPKGYDLPAALAHAKGILHIPYVDHDTLVSLYAGAVALIHPSLYEGFGLTLLEAMACGTPVIACAAAAIPEVVGDGGHLIESCSKHEIIDALTRFERVPGIRETYVAKGLRQAERFKWRLTAQETLKVYERLLPAL